MKKRIVILTMIFICFVTIGLTQDPNPPISRTNINKLTKIHSFDGECANFDSNETVITTAYGLFDLVTGEQRAGISADYAEWVTFSPDGRWLKAGDKLYSVETGEIILSLPVSQVYYTFSEDSRFVYIHGIIYDTNTWQEIDEKDIPDFTRFDGGVVWRDITSGNGMPTYLSPLGDYWVHAMDGIYRTDTGELIDLPNEIRDPAKLESGVFSPNDSLFFIRDDGVYTTPTFEKIYDFVPEVGLGGRISAPFSPDNDYFAIAADAIYEAHTGKPLVSITDRAVFSHNNEWAGTSDGLYELATGELIHELGSVSSFGPDDKLVIVDQLYVFDTASGEKRFDLEDVMWRDLYFNADGSLLYGVSAGNELLIYDTANGDMLQTLPATASILSTNERYLGLTTNNNCQLYAIER